MAPRAEGPSASPFKHLERQPALSALNDTKGVSGAVANPPLSAEPHAKSLSERAREAMDLWFGTLSHEPEEAQDAAKLVGTPGWQYRRGRASTGKDRS